MRKHKNYELGMKINTNNRNTMSALRIPIITEMLLD
jgi:hypothetical protein